MIILCFIEHLCYPQGPAEMFRNVFILMDVTSNWAQILITVIFTLTKVLHFAIGKPMAYHGKFAVKRTAKSTLANYSKLSRAKHRGKKRSPASYKRMANNGIFTFHGVKASHGLPRYFSLQIKKKPGKSAAFCQKMLVFWTPEKPQQTAA